MNLQQFTQHGADKRGTAATVQLGGIEQAGRYSPGAQAPSAAPNQSASKPNALASKDPARHDACVKEADAQNPRQDVRQTRMPRSSATLIGASTSRSCRWIVF